MSVMYCSPPPPSFDAPQVSDDDLERFGWYVLISQEALGGRAVMVRTLTMERPE